MARTRTWTAQIPNESHAEATIALQAAAIMFRFKQLLVDNTPAAGRWTVPRSSPGDGTYASSDTWADTGDLVWAAGAANHSWIVLQSPADYPTSGKRMYILIDCHSANAYEIKAFAASQDFDQGPSATAAPTTAAAGRTFSFANGAVFQWLYQPVAAARVNGARNTLGDFVFGVLTNGTARMRTAFHAARTQREETGDTYPWFAHFYYQDAASAPTVDQYETRTSVWRLATFWTDNGAINGASVGFASPYIESSSVNPLSWFDSLGSDISGDFPRWETELVCGVANIVHHKGVAVDTFLAPYGSGVLQGTEGRVSGVLEYAIVGRWWWPLDVAPDFGA